MNDDSPTSEGPNHTARSVGDSARDRLKRPFGAAVDPKLRPTEPLGVIGSRIARLSTLELKATGPIKPAEPEVLIARQAAARVESEDGWHDMAAHRLSGAFDGDAEQRIALATLDILDEMGLLVAAVSRGTGS